MKKASPKAGRSWSRGLALAVGDDGEDVLLGQDQVLGFVELDLAAGVLGVDDAVADFDVERLALAGRLDEAAVADGLDHAFLRLLLGGVGQHDPALGLLFALDGLDYDAIAQWT